MIEPTNPGSTTGTQAPNAFEPQSDGFCLTPQYQLFGSDELSVHADAVAAMVGLPVARIAPDDAQRLGLTANDGVAIVVDGASVNCAAVIDSLVPKGTLGYTVGHPATLALQSGRYTRLERLADFCREPEVIARDGVAAHG